MADGAKRMNEPGDISLRDTFIAIAAYIFACVGVVVLLTIYVKPADDSTKKKDIAQATAFILAGGAGTIGIYFTWKTLQNTMWVNRKTLEQVQEGQVTERFTRAVELLGATNNSGTGKQLESRLGGIYALERIAKDSKKDYGAIMEILTAYVRDNFPWSSESGEAQTLPRRTDLLAVVTVIKRREGSYRGGEEYPLDLHGTDLRSTDFHKARLESANLAGANLTSSDLKETILKDADLRGANLSNTHLERANLHKTKLDEADLRYADLGGIKEWKEIESLEFANVYGVANAPEGFKEWALKEKGAIDADTDKLWRARIRHAKYLEKG